jgi:hypothetical protein
MAAAEVLVRPPWEALNKMTLLLMSGCGFPIIPACFIIS